MNPSLLEIELEQKYLNAISPSKMFKNLEEVKEFIKEYDNKEDLIWFLRACEQDEMYEFCRFLKEVINE